MWNPESVAKQGFVSVNKGTSLLPNWKQVYA
jgi:hypothetical protein